MNLPPETIHLPFEAGPYRMAMGLTTVPDAAWFEIDALYPSEMAERRRLLAEHHHEVFAALPGTESACQETLALISDNLTRSFPTWFSRDGERLTNHLTSETWDLSAPAHHPLELAGRLVQEDLCIIQDGAFRAAVLCFPTRWRLHEKLGRPLADVHGAVPFYPDRLARPVDRFLGAIRDGHIAQRVNWSVVDNGALFQPTGKWREAHNAAITADNAGEALFLRSERQTLRRLPDSGTVLFGIRVHSYPLRTIVSTPEIAARLASAVRALPREMLHYKSMLTIEGALLAWLDSRS